MYLYTCTLVDEPQWTPVDKSILFKNNSKHIYPDICFKKCFR